MKKLQSIMQSEKGKLFLKVILYIFAAFVLILGLLENDGSDVVFVYNNF